MINLHAWNYFFSCIKLFIFFTSNISVNLKSNFIGVLAVSWYPPNDADNEGKNPDKQIPLILDLANKYHLKVRLMYHILRFLYVHRRYNACFGIMWYSVNLCLHITQNIYLEYKKCYLYLLSFRFEVWKVASSRAGTIYQYIDKIDILKADTRIDTIYQISIREKNSDRTYSYFPFIKIIQF